jgi:hypothetical protein
MNKVVLLTRQTDIENKSSLFRHHETSSYTSMQPDVTIIARWQSIANRRNSKKGVAIFFVLFVIVILGTLFAQFSFSSRNAQRTVHRFQTSEMARQLAAAAQEEAFKYLYDITDNPDAIAYEQLKGKGKEILYKIISRSNEIDMSKEFNRDSIKGIDLDVSKTKTLAKEKLGDNLEISAKARIIDYKTVDVNGKSFYKNEAVGTMEIAVTVKAKESYNKIFPGSCTMIRHHDYKVVNLLSIADNEGNRTNNAGEDGYAGSSFLDYVLFLRRGYEEFYSDPSDYGLSLNPPTGWSLEINAGIDGSLGKVHFGTYDNNYIFLNISDENNSFITDAKKEMPLSALTSAASDIEVNKFLPIFKRDLEAEAKKKAEEAIKKEGADPKGIKASVSGHRAIFSYKKLPITDDFINKNNNLKEARNVGIADSSFLKKPSSNSKDLFYSGIKIKPEDKLPNILTSDIRKQYLNYGYFCLDLSKCVIKIKGKAKKGLVEEKVDEEAKLSECPEAVKKYKDTKFICPNGEHITSKNVSDYNLKSLHKFVISHGGDNIASKAFTYINDEYNYYQNKDVNERPKHATFFDKNFSSGVRVYESCYPYANFNLFNKRFINYAVKTDSLDELAELGILTENKGKKVLNLRGIIQCSKPVELGDIVIKGSGVLMARGITINGGITRDESNPNSVCVLFSRNDDIKINTDKEINAALIAMKCTDLSGVNMGKVSGILCPNNNLNLNGSLVVDKLYLTRWKNSGTHKIKYDGKLAPKKDVYALNLSRWVTFERVIENE